MRLLIAGTLTLVIYLMACAYGNKEKKPQKLNIHKLQLHYFGSHHMKDTHHYLL